MSAIPVEQKDFEALRDTASALRILADSVTDCAMYLLDPQGRVATWNSGAQRLKQYTAQEIIGQHYSCFYMPEDIAAGRPDAALARALADGRAEDEGWRRRQDGSTFWAHDVITPIFDSVGKHLGFGEVARDVSREMSQVHMRSVLDHVLDGIISTDESGTIQSFNLAAENIFGYRQAEVIGQDVKMLMPEALHNTDDSYSGGYLRSGSE
jgi:two-component system sensor kinase FixL